MRRFWNKVKKTKGCWEWTAAKQTAGYGLFRIEDRLVRAHRFSLELSGIEIPSGMDVCHTCDNPPCVNPDHLFIGTRKENMQDASKKGRLNGKRPLHTGEKHSNAKLTEEDVRWIRQLSISERKLAKIFNVGYAAIHKIKARQTWAHI